mgnify:CR=1 FL=1
MQNELLDEGDAVDRILMSLPWFLLLDVIEFILELLERVTDGDASKRESSALLLSSSRRPACILGSLALLLGDRGSISMNAMPLLLLTSLEDFFVSLQLVEKSGQVPLLQIPRLVSRVQHLGFRVEIHATNGEEHGFSILVVGLGLIMAAGHTIITIVVVCVWVTSTNLLELIVESLPAE